MIARRLVLLCFLTSLTRGFALGPAELFKKVSPSVVVVRSTEGGAGGLAGGSQGSGVVIAQGTVITNYHVVSHAPVLQVEHQGTRYPAKVQFVDAERDLCQLEVEGFDAPPIQRVSYKRLSTGDEVFAIGAPQGLDLTLSQGLVSSIRVKGESILIQTSAAISKGSSGGGLFDNQGRLAGITTLMVATGQNLNFAVPSDWIADLPARTLVSSAEEGELLLKVTMHTRKKELAKAMDAASSWLKLAPKNAFALTNRGDVFMLLKRYDDAIQDYLKIYPLKGEGFEGFRLASFKAIGEAYGFLHRYHAAIKAYQRFVDLMEARPEKNPQQVMLIAYALEKMALCNVRLENYPEALRYFSLVGKLMPSSPAPSVSMGRVQAWAGEPAKALEFFQQGLQIAPGNANIFFEMGRAHAALRQSHEAITLWNKAKGVAPWSGFCADQLGQEYLRSNHREEALVALQKAVSERPGKMELWGTIGKLLLEKKNYSGAVEALTRFLRSAPEKAGYWNALGKAHLKLKDYGSAEQALYRSTVLEPERAVFWYLLGLARIKEKHLEGAIIALEKAVERKPRSASILYKLGVVSLARGDKQRVRTVLRKLKGLNRGAALKLMKKARARGLFRGRKG
jgi:tetratricopeptide (TPR) repeat protein